MFSVWFRLGSCKDRVGSGTGFPALRGLFSRDRAGGVRIIMDQARTAAGLVQMNGGICHVAELEDRGVTENGHSSDDPHRKKDGQKDPLKRQDSRFVGKKLM